MGSGGVEEGVDRIGVGTGESVLYSLVFFGCGEGGGAGGGVGGG